MPYNIKSPPPALLFLPAPRREGRRHGKFGGRDIECGSRHDPISIDRFLTEAEAAGKDKKEEEKRKKNVASRVAS